MTQFIKLLKVSKNTRTLELFEVIENGKHSWLVQNINKRLTANWFLDYSRALNYFKKCNKRYF